MNQWPMRRSLSKLTMPLVAVAIAAMCTTPTSAAVVSAPPTAIAVSQDNFTVSADVTVDDVQTVGTVTVQVDSNAPQTLKADDNGTYSKNIDAADIGSVVIFRATALTLVNGKKVASDWFASQPFTTRRALPPVTVSVTQNDLTLSVAIGFARGTMLGMLSMKVGAGSYGVICNANAGDNCGDGPYDIDMTEGQIGKAVIFRIVTTPTLDSIPDAVPFFTDPYTLAQAAQPTDLAVTQDGYNLNIAVTVGPGETVGEVIVRTTSSPDGDFVTPVKGQYIYELSPDDLGHVVRVTATADLVGQATSTMKVASITPSIASQPKFGVVKQAEGVAATVPVTIPSTSSLSVQATVGGADRAVTVKLGVARVALYPADANQKLVFYAHGTKGGLPDSDEVATDEFIIAGATAPYAVTVTEADTSLCGKPELDVNQTIGSLTASVNGVRRQIVVSGGKSCIELTKADVGKSVVFSASARRIGQVDSLATDSEPFVVVAAAKPVVTLAQKGKLITATIKIAAGQQVGLATYVVGKSSAVILKPSQGKYTIKVSKALVGKKIVVKAYTTQAGLFPSATVSSKALRAR